MKKLLIIFSLLLFCSSVEAQIVETAMISSGVLGSSVAAGGPNVYYYSYGGSATSYATCDNTPSSNYHNGGLVTATQGGIVTSFGVKGQQTNTEDNLSICMLSANGATRLGCCVILATLTTAWWECTSQSIAVSTGVSYLILISTSSYPFYSCRCGGGSAPDCAIGDGKYTEDHYSATCATSCPEPVTGLGDDTGLATGVRIYVD